MSVLSALQGTIKSIWTLGKKGVQLSINASVLTGDKSLTMVDQDINIGEFLQPLSTGFEGTPPVLTINGGDNTKFDLSAGTIVHVDSSTNPPTVTETVVSAQVAVTPTFLASETASFISIDSAGAIVQRSSRATPQQRRETAEVGLVSHVDNATIDAVVNTPTQNIDVASQAHDIIRALGFFSTSGNQIAGIPASLTISKSAGTGFALNENANVNQKDPHNISLPALSPITLVQILQDATVVATSSTIDPTTYDNGGVATTVPANNNATISYVYAFPNNTIVYLFGQEVFATFADAKDTAGSETVVLPTDIAEGALLLARIILKKSATDITDPTEAFILPAAAIASGGSSLTALQQAYDISVEPEILTDSSRGAVSIQRGSALDTDDVFETKNGAGVQKFRVTGEGDVLAHVIDILHSATFSDDHALEIDANAAGFGDVKAIDIVYITGAIAAGQDEAIQLINIDESAATGGDVVGLEVLATEGLAKIFGMLCGVNVAPIEQLSGAFENMDSALSNAVNVLTEFTTAGNDVQIFAADNDTVTIGNATKFEEIEFLLAVVASGAGIAPTFEYSTGVGTWATFTPVDGTNGMKNSGVIQWLDGDIPSWAVGTGSEYLIRITRTRNTLATPPTESKVQIAAAVEYCWDKDGNIEARSLKATTPSGSTAEVELAGPTNNYKLLYDEASGLFHISYNGTNIFTVTTNGQIKITGGSPGNGKKLVSDAAGLATWEDVDIKSLDDYTATGNNDKTIPAGATRIEIEVVGAGGGGGGGGVSTTDTGGGGGAGGYCKVILNKADWGADTSVRVANGTGGTGGTGTGAGGDGTNTVVTLQPSGTVVCTANGGLGGDQGDNYGEGGLGGAASIGGAFKGFAIPGENGHHGHDAGTAIDNKPAPNGATSKLGQGGHGAHDGAGGDPAAVATNGLYGGGGGGGSIEMSSNGGDGGDGRGIVTIE
jgi:hypothetical protein